MRSPRPIVPLLLVVATGACGGHRDGAPVTSLAPRAVRTEILSAYTRSHPAAGDVRHPPARTTFYARYRGREWALAWLPGMRDQPEGFARREGARWRDLGGYGQCSIPRKVVGAWHLWRTRLVEC
jgi:hypothetical protein